MIYCDGCHEVEAVYLVSVKIEVLPVGGGAPRMKQVVLRLCPECERAMGTLVRRDVEQPQRVAMAMTGKPRVIFRSQKY